MISLDDIFAAMNQYKDILELIAIIIISFIIFNIVLKLIKKSLLEKVKTKKQRSNVTVFTDFLKFKTLVSMS